MLSDQDEMRTCKVHGFTPFKYRKSKKGNWYVCHLCLKLQYKKAQDKKRKNPEYIKFHREYSKQWIKITRKLSLFIVLIDILTSIKLPD